MEIKITEYVICQQDLWFVIFNHTKESASSNNALRLLNKTANEILRNVQNNLISKIK